ncbi:DUF2971 domain-containing protein [Shimia sp. Alg240-R146]|uniref:DUF2971 domain-containing protein n=1 Tax=Shimia sp. Alg240-R146 TaxID=2993449 RepID=UPI0022E85506|nr:DUF2971 domain-containing protein [Shimia sp. Alg240-R146]
MFKFKKRLYYFTGPNFALDVVSRRHLKISFPNEVNDLFEMMPFDFGQGKKAKDMRLDWQNAIAVHSQEFGFISFSERWDVPSMWGHYAESYAGVCLGFDVTEKLTKMVYESDFKEFPYEDLGTEHGKKQIFAYAQETKSIHWQFEVEWRRFVHLSEDEIALKKRGARHFFTPFDHKLELKEVLIGPRSNLTSKQFRKALGSYEGVDIKTVRASFRNYKMTTQKLKKLQK